MNKIFFGKISKAYPQQFKEKYYAGGKSGSSWYNGLEIGDLVFPIFNQAINELWKVKAYDSTPNSINEEGSVQFEVVKNYTKPITISTTFARYKYFELDLTMLNKSMKSTASEKIGFFPITHTSGCPSADLIDFNDLRNIYISIDNTIDGLPFKDRDVRLLIDRKDNLLLKELQIYQNNKFVRYDVLQDLYLSKNKDGQRYSLEELLEYANTDNANKKEKYLDAVINGIKNEGYFIVTSPVSLYDNILVGRKKSASPKNAKHTDEAITAEDESDDKDELTITDFDDYKEYVDLLKSNPNLVLYGPPGTGKTYSAEKIVEAFEYDRTNKLLSYKAIQDEGRVSFVTFHQSFSYEEFVEGLRPVINSEENGNPNGENLKYKVQDGILKQIAEKSSLSQLKGDNSPNAFSNISEDSRIWKISLGERFKEESVYDSCIKTNTIAIGWFHKTDIGNWDYDKIYSKLIENLPTGAPKPINQANSINYFVNEMQEGDIVMVFASPKTARAIGVVTGPYEWKKEFIENYPQRRNVQWLRVFDKPIDIVKYNGNKKMSQVTLYELSNMGFLDVKEMLTDKITPTIKELKKVRPYFIIIDEINRGNIAKVFGEMITLIEKDKRDKIKVLLPYSQKPFSLPSNLFIIGTMNTADRSIAVLDTALRRRFLFKEIEPNIEIIRRGDYLIEDDLDLSRLAQILNSKISHKIDRDHRLGHSYFMEVFDLHQFKITWYYQIIPLLMEYFYNEGKNIAEIITDKFIDKETSQIKWIQDNKEFKQALIDIYNKD